MPLTLPTTTATFAAIFALIYAALTVWVMVSRTRHNALEGDGGSKVLGTWVRAHGNFGEYVPLALIVIGLYEGAGGRHGVVLGLLLALLVGRLLHPVGLFATPNTPPMFLCRGGGMLLTLIALVGGAIGLLA